MSPRYDMSAARCPHRERATIDDTHDECETCGSLLTYRAGRMTATPRSCAAALCDAPAVGRFDVPFVGVIGDPSDSLDRVPDLPLCDRHAPSGER